MEIIRSDINVDFVGMRFNAFVFSVVLILASLAMMVARGGLNLGVDFAGGTLVQIKFEKPTTPDQIRGALGDLGMGESAIQQVGAVSDNEFLIRTDVSTEEMANLSNRVGDAFNKAFGEGQSTVRRAEMVGPKVGQDLRQKALFAIYYAMLFIAIYISGRFEMKWGTAAIMVAVMMVGVYLLEAIGLSVVYLIIGAFVVMLGLCWVLKLPYALAAVLALLHDVLITVGVFVFLDKEFTLEILAALLTIAGYSLNDTIVVFDRVRENLRKEKRQPFISTINSSINQTLSRTVLTGGTTLLALLFLFFFGGTVIHDFALAMLIGILTGTYSSIFVASPLLILYEDWTGVKRKPARAAAA
jgi:preprotein translocase subunit SecF